MNYIEKMLQDYCPNGVEWKELGEVAEIKNGFAFKSSLYSEYGIRVIRISDVQKGTLSDKDIKFYPLEKKDEVQNYLLAENDLVMSLTGNVGRVAMVPKDILPAGLNQRVACIRPRKTTLVRYLFHFLGQSCFELEATQNATGGGQKNLSTTWLAKYKIPIPPLEIQKEIVALLDKFTEYVTELTAELTDRQKQYSFYRDKLLSFEDEVYQVEWKTLGEVAENLDYLRKPVTKGSRSSGIYPYYGASGIVDYVDDYIFDGDYLLVSEDGANLIARKTPIAFSVTGKSWINNHAHVLKFESDIDRKYVSYYLNHIDLTPYISGAAQPKLNQQNLNSIKLAYPKQEVRNKIVQVLDNFDAVCNDLNIGLPKEIELRQKQYEYFREKLLTFTAEGVYPGQWTVSGNRLT